MSFPRGTFLRILSAVAFATLLGPVLPLGPDLPAAHARTSGADPSRAMHWSADKAFWNRREDTLELIGHASLSMEDEQLRADYIFVDMKNRTVDGKGDCIYNAAETVIRAEEIHFNLDTRVGTIIKGKITNGEYLLTGERINKLSDRRFQTHRAEYTTCRNCPGDWTFQGEDVDVEFEGYATMSNVTAKVLDTPVVWFPYLIIPVKTQRQTGLLFPKIGFSSNLGFKYVQPFFWAISRSFDMTIGAGRYFRRGNRLEWEGRYALGPESRGEADVFYVNDEIFSARRNRWAVEVEQRQRWGLGINQKLRFVEISDNRYPIDFDDVPGREQPVISSDFILDSKTSQVSTYIAFRRYRSLLNFDDVTEFDRRTVQLYPRAVVTSNDRLFLDGKVAAGLTLGMSNFTRSAGPFDFDLDNTSGNFQPGTDPVREATRLAVTPSLYTTLRPWDVLWVVPSLQYRGYYYDFHDVVPDLTRGYLLFQTETGLQFERIFGWPDPDIPKVKHIIRPTLSYSNIPYVLQPDHPFLRQIEFRPGYNFDNNDIVPIDATRENLVNYFEPLGNAVSYGLNTQLIRRRGRLDDPNASYQRFYDLSVGQSINLNEFEKPDAEQAPFSRFFLNQRLNLDRFSWNLQYFYYPHLPVLLEGSQQEGRSPHVVTTRMTYVIERGLRQKILTFDRSFDLGVNWSRISADTFNIYGAARYSLSDYMLPSVSATYDAIEQQLSKWNLAFTYQPPSRCWKLSTAYSERIDQPGFSFDIDFTLNLTGAGFAGFEDLAETVF